MMTFNFSRRAIFWSINGNAAHGTSLLTRKIDFICVQRPRESPKMAENLLMISRIHSEVPYCDNKVLATKLHTELRGVLKSFSDSIKSIPKRLWFVLTS